MLSSTPPGVSGTPIASSIADIYEGALEGKRFRVKKARDYIERDSREHEEHKVQYRDHFIYFQTPSS